MVWKFGLFRVLKPKVYFIQKASCRILWKKGLSYSLGWSLSALPHDTRQCLQQRDSQLFINCVAPLMVLIFMCFSNHLIKIKQGDETLFNMLWTNNYCQFNPTGNVSVLWIVLLVYSWSSIKQCMGPQFPGSGGLFLPFFFFEISSVIV